MPASVGTPLSPTAAPGRMGHCGAQFGTEPTALALLALHSSSSASTLPRQDLEPLLACQRPIGLWPAVGAGAADVSVWALKTQAILEAAEASGKAPVEVVSESGVKAKE